MPRWFRRWIARIPRWEFRLAFAEWIWRGLGFIGALAVGWWTAARAWVEGVITPYGTLGYVAVILGVAIALSIAFSFISWGISKLQTVNTYAPQPEAKHGKPLTIVKLQDFANKHVVIDGPHFINCKFHDCTLEYNGGQYELTTCDFTHGNIRVISRNEGIVGALHLCQAAGLIPGKVSTIVVLPDDAEEGVVELGSIKVRENEPKPDQSDPSRTD